MGRKSRNEEYAPIQVPLYIPTENNGGVGTLTLGTGEMRGNTLLIAFNDLIPAQAIRHRIERGGIVGITFVIPEDEAEEARQTEEEIARIQQEKRDQADLELLKEDAELTPDDIATE